MLGIIQTIAERKIQQAMEEGALPDLSHWKNKPLPQDDSLAKVPPDLRMAYKVLKNAGYIPEELALRKEILRTKMEQCHGRAICLDEDGPYYARVVERLSTTAK
ncbi:MAG: DUF1992 domain-containing protein [Desulfobulbus sp.]